MSATAETEPERADVDQRALRDHQHAERDEHERRDVGGRADRGADEVADRSAAEAEPEHGCEEDADRAEREPDQLRVVMCVGRPRARGFLAATLLDAARCLRGRLVGPLLARHARHFALVRGQSFRVNEAVSIPKYVGAS